MTTSQKHVKKCHLNQKHCWNINLDDQTEWMVMTPAIITLKDHKLDFRQNPLCWLVNPAKNELGKVGKLIIEKINKKLISEIHFNQWKNTDSVFKSFIADSSFADCYSAWHRRILIIHKWRYFDKCHPVCKTAYHHWW